MGDLHRLGPKGEDFALKLLKKRGHKLLERNFRCAQGELDLVTWHRGTLVFVEVRARDEKDPAHPAETVTPAKQKKVVRAAHWYLARRAGDREPPPCRFDVVWVTARDGAILDGGVIEGAFGA
ncbi:MAG: YraN family protein [Planctomycetota bacterium]|nr:YraN family protein [Planctomycetota bacterium]